MARVALTGANLLDGTGADPVPGQTILWEAGVISWIGPDEEANLEQALVIPADGGTVLPGLIDSHVHISLPPTLTGVTDVENEPVERTLLRAANGAGVLLRAGITTARDVGSRAGVAIDVAAAQRDGDLIGSRLLASGRGITPPDGHGMTISVQVQGAEDVADAVRAEHARGADLIKLFPTGGVLGAGTHGFDVVMTLDEMWAAVQTAHELDIHVAAHVHGPEGIDLALEAGVDTIEHGTGATREQSERMVEDGVALVPTLAPMVALRQRALDLPRDLIKRVEEVEELQAESVRTAIEVGVRVLPGTDAGTPFNPPGGLVQEMELLVDLGMSHLDVITAATSLAAQTFDWEDVGVLAVGNVADLLLVDGDPLDDLGTLSWPATIVQDGVVI
ncbi:MAG: amidohydrolase family protein [Acidimicrobiia bacterium]|nr:amidohydrolase family protein [Acidimicrobiia bacterium]MBT8217722.1 amidohydrolase family protein [Acidimicrobiia bacterium]NNL71481.1 amidohydrolase family protein [Acidimicrobiia bacterium]